MKLLRRQFLTSLGVGAGAVSIAKPAIAQLMPNIKWRLTASWPRSLDTLYGACEVSAKRVAEITDNRFQIQVFAAGEIVPALEVLDAVQNQTIEMGHTATAYWWGKEAALTFGTALPFGLNTRQMESWLVHGGGNDLVQDVLASFNCYGIPMGNTGAQMGAGFARRSARWRICGALNSGSQASPARSSPGSTWCRSRLPPGISTRTRKGHHRRSRVYRAPRRRKARLSEDREILLLSRLVEGEHEFPHAHQP